MSDRIDLYPVVITETRYGGTYEGLGARWVAFTGPQGHYEYDLGDWDGSDMECAEWWWQYHEMPWVATGATPDEALAALYDKNEVKT